MTFYVDLLTNLNNNKILMQTASYNEVKNNNTLDVAIAITDSNPIRLSSYSAFISSQVAKNHNIDLNKINYNAHNAWNGNK